MPHTDPYRLTPSGSRDEAPDGTGGAGVLRTLLWLVLVISVIGNTVASYTGAGVGVHLGFGLVTGVCATVLVVRRLRSRR